VRRMSFTAGIGSLTLAAADAVPAPLSIDVIPPHASSLFAQHPHGRTMTEIPESVRIVYTNYRGETAIRAILPRAIQFGATDWHPEPQWLLVAFDVEKQAERSFAMKDIRAWLGH